MGIEACTNRQANMGPCLYVVTALLEGLCQLASSQLPPWSSAGLPRIHLYLDPITWRRGKIEEEQKSPDAIIPITDTCVHKLSSSPPGICMSLGCSRQPGTHDAHVKPPSWAYFFHTVIKASLQCPFGPCSGLRLMYACKLYPSRLHWRPGS